LRKSNEKIKLFLVAPSLTRSLPETAEKKILRGIEWCGVIFSDAFYFLKAFR
jgi:hypothetical protein